MRMQYNKTLDLAQSGRALLLSSTILSTIVLALGLGTDKAQAFDDSFSFIPGDLLVSSSYYTGTASTVTVGQTLPGGGNAIATAPIQMSSKTTRSTAVSVSLRRSFSSNIPFPATLARCLWTMC